jgi:membrane-associated phospholipid phosphatase
MPPFGTVTDQWITRFGEAGIVLPIAFALAVWWLIAARSVRLASSWLVPLALAVAVTTASKIAFLGWGVGIASIDFTGFSGHAMFAAAIYPMLAFAMTAHWRAAGRPHAAALAIGAGYVFAALVALSRVRVGAHSPSEAIAGFALGALASAAALWLAGHARRRLPVLWAGTALFVWLAVMPVEASPSRTHGMVTQLALALSGRSVPFQRADLHRDAMR